jgi:hypothetical protein
MYKVKGPIEDNQIHDYGKDIEAELTSMLAEELANQIDKEILRSLGVEPDKNKRRKNKIDKIFKSFE